MLITDLTLIKILIQVTNLFYFTHIDFVIYYSEFVI